MASKKKKLKGIRANERRFRTLLTEYVLLASSWRFLTGIRFTLLAFSTTLQSALLVVYQYVLLNFEKLGAIGLVSLWAVPALGFIATASVILIEERTRSLYGACLLRGRTIELELQNPLGHFHTLWNTPLPHNVVTHSRALRLLYLSALVAWLYLLYRAIMIVQ